MSKPLRETMPGTAEFIDACREAFGTDDVNAQIKLGMQGAKTFHARENGNEVGTAMPGWDELRGIALNKMVIRPPEKKDKNK